MKKTGQIILFRFPQTNFFEGKLRPALLIEKIPGNFNDFLVCMISSQLHQEIKGFDELINSNSSDYVQSGLKVDSVVRIVRLAIIHEDRLVGTIGEIGGERLKRIKDKLAGWITGK